MDCTCSNKYDCVIGVYTPISQNVNKLLEKIHWKKTMDWIMTKTMT